MVELMWELKRTDPDAFRTAWMALPMSKRNTYALAKIGEIFDEYDTELTKFRAFRNFVSEGKPERASAGQAVTLLKFGLRRISGAEYEYSRERLTRIGWTKLEMIAARVTLPKTAPMFLSLAERFTARDLRCILNGKAALGKANILQLARLPEDYEIVVDMLVRHGTTKDASGLTGKEEAQVKAAVALDAHEKRDKAKE